MKKNKRTLGLLVGLLSVLSLSGCSADVTEKDGTLITFEGADGKTITIDTDDIYNAALDEQANIKILYDAIFEVAIRVRMSKPDFAATLANIKATTQLWVDGLKEQARDNAKNNNTRYEDEWDSILTQNKADDEKELFNNKAFQLMSEEYRTKFFSTEKLSEMLVEKESDTGYSGYLEEMVPYHIRHILVNTNGGDKDFTSDTIGKTEAEKLSSVIRQLADGKMTFGEVARENSEDTGGEYPSHERFGDLGVMDKRTEFVNEFKLGVYAYDLFYGSGRSEAQDVLGLSDTVRDSYLAVPNLASIGQIPYGIVNELYTKADTTTNAIGGSVNEGDARFYPRNVIFNRFFNRHNVCVITPNTISAPTVGSDGTVTGEDINGSVDSSLIASSTRWQTFNMKDGSTLTCLADEQGNPILVARAGSGYQGIHFIIVERNPMDVTAPQLPAGNGATIQEYYTTLTPGTPGFPQTTGATPADKKTFVNFLNFEKNEQLRRANTTKNNIKSYDSTIDYRIFEELFVELKIEFKDSALEEKIENYIAKTRQQNGWNSETAFENAWKDYIRMLTQQEQLRSQNDRLLSYACALGFATNTNDKAFTEPGGACYYVKK